MATSAWACRHDARVYYSEDGCKRCAIERRPVVFKKGGDESKTYACVRCGNDNKWCPVAYPAYCTENVAWKKCDGKWVFISCCVCVFNIAPYRGRGKLPPCNCENVAKGLASK
jgi:hypothetical protein